MLCASRLSTVRACLLILGIALLSANVVGLAASGDPVWAATSPSRVAARAGVHVSARDSRHRTDSRSSRAPGCITVTRRSRRLEGKSCTKKPGKAVSKPKVPTGGSKAGPRGNSCPRRRTDCGGRSGSRERTIADRTDSDRGTGRAERTHPGHSHADGRTGQAGRAGRNRVGNRIRTSRRNIPDRKVVDYRWHESDHDDGSVVIVESLYGRRTCHIHSYGKSRGGDRYGRIQANGGNDPWLRCAGHQRGYGEMHRDQSRRRLALDRSGLLRR